MCARQAPVTSPTYPVPTTPILKVSAKVHASLSISRDACDRSISTRSVPPSRATPKVFGVASSHRRFIPPGNTRVHGCRRDSGCGVDLAYPRKCVLPRYQLVFPRDIHCICRVRAAEQECLAVGHLSVGSPPKQDDLKSASQDHKV